MKVIVSRTTNKRTNERTNEETGRGRGINDKETKEQDCQENARTYNTIREQYYQFGYQNSEQYRHCVRFDCSIAHSKALGDCIYIVLVSISR